jgi:hypothetical protein
VAAIQLSKTQGALVAAIGSMKSTSYFLRHALRNRLVIATSRCQRADSHLLTSGLILMTKVAAGLRRRTTDSERSAALIGHLLGRLSALALLCCRRLALHLFLSILGRRRRVSRRAVHSAGRRVLSICRTGRADGLTGVTRRGARTGVLGGLAASITRTCLCCCNA